MKPSAFSLFLLLTGLRADPAPPIIIRPNADAVLDLAGIGQGDEGDPIINPFRVRYHPQVRIREVPLAVNSVLVGLDSPSASAIINGEIYSPGDAWEGLSVAAITADRIELRLGKITLQVPVEDRPLTVRISR